MSTEAAKSGEGGSVTLLSISEVTLYEMVSNIKVMYVWMIFISFVYRYEQVRQRIKIHNC